MPVFPASSLSRLISVMLVEHGASSDLADQVAEILTDNHLAGHDSHGILRLPFYLDDIREGRIDPTAWPSIVDETASTATVRGNRGFGQVVAAFAADVATEKALRERISAVSVVDLGHTGRLAAFTERAARRGVAMFMAIGTVGNPITAPYGGAAGVLGTNPVSFSFPNSHGAPITLDYATSAIANGKVKVAQARGESLPEGCIVDREGRPSTNPADLYDGGFLLPFGGHKGYALAVVAEMLGGPMTGADDFPGAGSRSGAFLFGISAEAFRARADYDRAVGSVIARLTSVPAAPGFDRVMVPGEPESAVRVQREADGIPIPERTWEEIVRLAAARGIDTDAILSGSQSA